MRGLILITSIVLLTLYALPGQSIDAFERKGSTSVEAMIDYVRTVKVFGYTAPNTIIQATAARVFATGTSDKTGYFVIDELPISAQAKELCIVTVDAERRTGFPLCIALPSVSATDVIGPLILSPTISLSKKVIWQNETAVVTGFTLPDTEIQISFFTQEGTTIAQSISNTIVYLLNPTAQAAGFPIISGKSDRKGNYSINLPTNRSRKYRVFSKSLFQDIPSIKSQTLSFTIGSSLDYFLAFIFPKIVIAVSLALAAAIVAYIELHTRLFRRHLKYFSEKKLQPFGVRARLLLRRILYNLRGYWK